MIYLDNGATSFPKPDSVYGAMIDFVKESGANPGRSGHRRAVAADQMIQETRRLVAQLFEFSRPERVIFTLNATDALNMALKSVLNEGDHVITSVLEHNSVNRPLNRLEAQGLVQVTRIPADVHHLIDPDLVKKALRSNTKMLAFTHASNVTGTIQPIRAFGKIAREINAVCLIDASQSAGVLPIQMDSDFVDLLAFTGHKGLLGPTGTGGLLVGDRVKIRPWREGGTGGDSTSPLQPEEFPHRMEGGTPNVFGLAGLREGIKLILKTGVDRILAHERNLLIEFFHSLKNPDLINWYGAEKWLQSRDLQHRLGLLSLNFKNFISTEAAAILDQQFDIAVRPGLHCAPLAHRHLGTEADGTVRISVGWLNTVEQMREAATAFDELANS